MRILTLRFFATIPLHLRILKLSTNLETMHCPVHIKGQLEKRGQVAEMAQLEQILLFYQVELFLRKFA